VHHEPPDVTWPLPEPDAGVVDGELSPLEEELPEDELPDEEDAPLPLDVPELAEAPEPEVAGLVLLAAEPDEAWWVAPGRLNATAPAATRLAAAAETVTARSRATPRSRSLAPGQARCGAERRGTLLWW
jgi:hypothetical protein